MNSVPSKLEKNNIDELYRKNQVKSISFLVILRKEINGINVVTIDHSVDPVMLKNAAFMLQKEAQNLVIAAAFEAAGKPQLLLMYSEDLVKAGKNAGADVREAAKLIMGGGGGQAGLATAGGKNTDGLADALAKLVESATK